MAYTNVWDVTAPLNTQPANQGAVDFRATKLDVMQRIASFGAGLLANRPTPEVTSGTADWTGVMYWATDTKQAFRWSGAAWVDISANVAGGGSGSRIFCDGVPHTMAINTLLQTIYSGTVPGNSLGLTGGFKGRFYYELSTSIGQNLVVELLFGVTFIQIVIANATTKAGILDFSMINQNNAGQQSLVVTEFDNNNTILSSRNTGLAIDTTIDQPLQINAQKSQAGDSGFFLNGYAEVI